MFEVAVAGRTTQGPIQETDAILRRYSREAPVFTDDLLAQNIDAIMLGREASAELIECQTEGSDDTSWYEQVAAAGKRAEYELVKWLKPQIVEPCTQALMETEGLCKPGFEDATLGKILRVGEARLHDVVAGFDFYSANDTVDDIQQHLFEEIVLRIADPDELEEQRADDSAQSKRTLEQGPTAEQEIQQELDQSQLLIRELEQLIAEAGSSPSFDNKTMVWVLGAAERASWAAYWLKVASLSLSAEQKAAYERITLLAETAMDYLAECFEPMIHKAAWGLHETNSMSREDLCMEGRIGLLDAFVGFDPEKSPNLPAYAKLRIKGAMVDALRSKGHTIRVARSTINTVGEIQELKAQGLSDTEIEEALGLSDKQIAGHRKRAQLGKVLSLDAPVSGQDSDDLSLLDQVSDTREIERDEFDPDTLERLRSLGLSELPAMTKDAQMTDQERLVLASVFDMKWLVKRQDMGWFSKARRVKGKALALKDIGQYLGVTESRASQHFAVACNKLQVQKAFQAIKESCYLTTSEARTLHTYLFGRDERGKVAYSNRSTKIVLTILREQYGDKIDEAIEGAVERSVSEQSKDVESDKRAVKAALTSFFGADTAHKKSLGIWADPKTRRALTYALSGLADIAEDFMELRTA